MKKIARGIYKIRLGRPEKLTPMSFKAFGSIEYGSDNAFPFDENDIIFKTTKSGCSVTLPLGGKIYGFGLQLKRFEHTGHKVQVRPNADPLSASGDSHAPVPFYVTTAGYGVYVDTARYASFYCGEAYRKEEVAPDTDSGSTVNDDAESLYEAKIFSHKPEMLIEIPAAKGVDIYVFAGNDMLESVCKYNMFSGGGANPPEWGLGVWYRCYTGSNSDQWLEIAEKFKVQGMPVKVLGLEPGWQSRSYSCSYVWDKERSRNHEEIISKIRELGYHVNLWEHAFNHPASPMYDKLMPYSGDYKVWGGIVPDFALEEAREIFKDYHRDNVGADCYKLDECDGSDYTGGWSFPNSAEFPSGLDGEQMHSLFGTLYARTMNELVPNSYHSVRNMHAFAAPYPFVLYSDLYGHDDFIHGVVNAGFSGLLWSPEVRHASSLKDLIRRIQTVIFSPQALINAWYIKNTPWEQIDRDKNNRDEFMPEHELATVMVKELFKVRERFVPYLKKMYEQYAKTGKPVFRALILDYPDDTAVHTIDNQYMVGDDYMFAPLTASADERSVYIPEGKWSLNGVEVKSGWNSFKCSINEYLLFRKD